MDHISLGAHTKVLRQTFAGRGLGATVDEWHLECYYRQLVYKCLTSSDLTSKRKDPNGNEEIGKNQLTGKRSNGLDR